jgi:hypothetical protein
MIIISSTNPSEKIMVFAEITTALLTLRGPSLHSENTILSDKFRPTWTSFPFSISAPNTALSLTLPKWNTHHPQTVEPITKLMTAGQLHLDGSYLYHSDVREENVDQLRLRFTVCSSTSEWERNFSSSQILSWMTFRSSAWRGRSDIL